MKTALWWIRRDLRLSDNQALTAALSAAEQVLPVFVVDPFFSETPYAGEKRRAFLYDGLNALEASLIERGSALVVRSGNPVEVLSELLRETGGEGIFAEADFSPYALRRDEKIARELPLQLSPGLTVHPPDAVLKDDGQPYTVFTPFSKAWLKQTRPGRPHPAPERITTPAGLKSDRNSNQGAAARAGPISCG